MSTENRYGYWFDEGGYYPESDLILLNKQPELITVNTTLISQDDWHMISQLSAKISPLLDHYDFAAFETYQSFTAESTPLSLDELVTNNTLPAELLEVRTTILDLSKQYADGIEHKQIPYTDQSNQTKALYLMLLQVMSEITYDVSEDGLTAHSFEEDKPPMVSQLPLDLRSLKQLYACYFNEEMPSYAIEYALKHVAWFKRGLDAQYELLETHTETEDRRTKRNAVAFEYLQLMEAYANVAELLSINSEF